MTQAAYRLAATEFLSDFAGYAGIKLQMYPARPRTLTPPTGFVDRIRESFTPFTERHFQRTPLVSVIVVHGLFDSMDAANQKDAFVDGFLEWVSERPHQAGGNTLIRVSETEDIPDWVPDWLPSEAQRTYYATEITLEGFGTN